MTDCTIGKDFNPKSCRWIKGCRNGYSRNQDFKCVRGSDTKKEIGKEVVDLVKELFSNNGLANSISPQRTKSKRLRKSKKSRNNFNEFSGLNTSKSKKSKSYSESKQRIKQFIESIGENIVNIESDVFQMAKSKGIQIKNPRQQYLFRKMLMEYISSIKGKKKTKGKTVKFAKKTNEPPNASLNKPISKPKISKTKRPVSKKSNSNDPKPQPMQITNEDIATEEKIVTFLNTLGMKTIENLTTNIVMTKYKSAGIKLDSRVEREVFREIAQECIASYTEMNRERALKALELRKDYTLQNLEQNYRTRSSNILSNTNLNTLESDVDLELEAEID
jgi:hypothetical protein